MADGRVEPLGSGFFRVSSSMGDREYLVYLDVSRGVVYSNDNGTRFRGYIGYPIIAALMVMKVLPYNEKIASALKGLKWRRLNEKYKRYWLVEKIVKSIAKRRGVNPEEIDAYVREVLSRLSEMKLELLEEPPKTGGG